MPVPGHQNGSLYRLHDLFKRPDSPELVTGRIVVTRLVVVRRLPDVDGFAVAHRLCLLTGFYMLTAIHTPNFPMCLPVELISLTGA